MNSFDKLIETLNNDPYIKRIKEIEEYIDNNDILKKLIKKRQEVARKLLNAKHNGDIKDYQSNQSEYDVLTQNILDFPFVEEYLDLLEDYNERLQEMVSYLGSNINKGLREAD